MCFTCELQLLVSHVAVDVIAAAFFLSFEGVKMAQIQWNSQHTKVQMLNRIVLSHFSEYTQRVFYSFRLPCS